MDEIELPSWSWRLRIVAFVARLIPWAKLMPTLAAKWFGVLSLRIVDTPSKTFYGGTPLAPAYTMTQVWIANSTRIDIYEARATLHWHRRGAGRFSGRSVHGIWHKKVASGLASYPGGIEQQTLLPSNGDERHLGLAVKSAKTGKAYLVCTESHYDFQQWENYENPASVLEPGVYDVHIFIEAQGARKGLLKLQVTYSGGNSEVIVIEG